MQQCEQIHAEVSTHAPHRDDDAERLAREWSFLLASRWRAARIGDGRIPFWRRAAATREKAVSNGIDLPGDTPGMLLVNGCSGDRERLQQLGYTQLRTYRAIPSARHPHWLLPEHDRKSAQLGLSMYSPQTPTARIKKTMLTALVARGALGWVGTRVIIANRQSSALEHRLRRLFPDCDFQYCVSSGVASQSRKATVQVLGPGRTVLAYAKIARTAAANRTIRREADTLERLSHYPLLQGRIPQILDSFEVDEFAGLVLSPGPLKPGIAHLAGEHVAFWHRLHAATAQTLRFDESPFWQRLAWSVEEETRAVDCAWRFALMSAIERIRSELGGSMLEMSVAHRDFHAGNFRMTPDGRLFVLDWEGALEGVPPLYDLFHVCFLEHAFRHGRRGRTPADVATGIIRDVSAWVPEYGEQWTAWLLYVYLVDRAASCLRRRRLTHMLPSVRYPMEDSVRQVLDVSPRWLPA